MTNLGLNKHKIPFEKHDKELGNHDIFNKQFQKGNEFFPDAFISRKEGMDVRPSRTRQRSDKNLDEVSDSLLQIRFIFELKIGCSTSNIPRDQAIIHDIKKLSLFKKIYSGVCRQEESPLEAFLIIIDNHVELKNGFDDARMNKILNKFPNEFKKYLPKIIVFNSETKHTWYNVGKYI